MRYFWIRSLRWREFLLSYVSPFITRFASLLTIWVFLFVPLAPSSYTCYRDSSNDPKCSLYSTNTDTLTKTRTSPRPTGTSDGSEGDLNNNSSSSSDDSNSDDSNGINLPISSSSSSSSSRPTPSGSTSSGLNGAASWKDYSRQFVLAPFLVFIGTCGWRKPLSCSHAHCYLQPTLFKNTSSMLYQIVEY